MKIKINVTCAGLDFSYIKGKVVDAPKTVALDLIKAGYRTLKYE